MALLDVNGLSITAGPTRAPVTLIDDISFAIAAGESLGIVGESGCGKTLTALAIMGLLPEGLSATGSIRIDGQEIVNAGDDVASSLRGQLMAMVFQEPMRALNPLRTIGDQIAEAPRLHLGLGERNLRERVYELLARVGLPASRFPPGLYPHELSGGQRQRVLLAIALSASPSLLICDEPTTALDVSTQARILDLIVNVTAEEGASLLMISHDLGVIAEMTDRMMVMYAGTIAERGATADVFGQMAHPYTKGLFDALPKAATAPGGRLRAIPGKLEKPGPGFKIGCPFASRCRRASPRCRAGPPPRVAIGPRHEAMCFHPELT